MLITPLAIQSTEPSALSVEAAERRELIASLGKLKSESSNPNTKNIDVLSTEEILRAINREDKLVPYAVERVIPAITCAVDHIVDAFHRGGRLFYLGAGTSGRLGVLDAAECPPTFGVPSNMVQGVIAGGMDALHRAIEGAEDDADAGAKALQDLGLTCDDIAVGIAASGRTPYVIGGLTYARSLGATTVALACNPNAAIANMADIAILPDVGEEVLTGSTRLKSGTAQKLVLNMLTTTSMIRLGKCYKNYMVDFKLTNNKKLFARAAHLITQATQCTPERALAALDEARNNVKLAIMIVDTGVPLESANAALEKAGGNLGKAIATVTKVVSHATPAP